MSARRKLRIAFVHPDLGLGGAERLVIDAALGLQDRGHEPIIYTPHLDRRRAFEEVVSGKVLAHQIRVPVPRAVFGRLHALCAALRCALVALWVALVQRPDVAVVDIVTLPAAVLAFCGVPTLFYCHFPDKLLARTLVRAPPTPLRRAYRIAVDTLEARALAAAAAVAVNSRFTNAAFAAAFPRAATPHVVYPCAAPAEEVNDGAEASEAPFVVSLNRYERKKNVRLAVSALAELHDKCVNLVVAGGWDARVRENVEHYEELVNHARELGVSNRVRFERNVSAHERARLLRRAIAVLYTPSDEHFGIVPLEAMAAGTPVIAVNSGGPCETVCHGETGFLCEPEPCAFADSIQKLVKDAGLAARLGAKGRLRVNELFSRDRMAQEFEHILLRIRKW